MKRVFIERLNANDIRHILRYAVICFITMIVFPVIKLHTYFLYYLFNAITTVTSFSKLNGLMMSFWVSLFMGILTMSFIGTAYVRKKINKNQTDNILFITGALIFFALLLFSMYVISKNSLLIFTKVTDPKHLQSLIRQYVFSYILLPSLFISVSGLILSIKYYIEVIKNKKRRSKIEKILEYYRFLLCLFLTILLFSFTFLFLRYLYGFGLYLNSLKILNDLLIILAYVSIPIILFDFLLGINDWLVSYILNEYRK